MLHILHFQNNSKLLTSIMRFKKSVSDEVKKVGTFFNSN